MAENQQEQSYNGQQLTLHTYFRSSCSARVRIALNFKSIPYKPVYVNLLKGDHSSSEYDKINPSHFVPTLEIAKSQPPNQPPLVLTQSMAILEYIEEAFPDATPSLLPPASDVAGRAAVRTLANIIACDTQPPTNMRILVRINKMGGSKEQWAKELMEDGLSAYERVSRETAGKFSVGDNITLADICLVPAVWGAQRFGADMNKFPTVMRVYGEMSRQEAVLKGHWQNQEDTPADLRG